MTTAWDDLAAENAWLRKEMEAMSGDILRVQCELAELTREREGGYERMAANHIGPRRRAISPSRQSRRNGQRRSPMRPTKEMERTLYDLVAAYVRWMDPDATDEDFIDAACQFCRVWEERSGFTRASQGTA